MTILDKLIEYRNLTLRLEELRNKHGGKLKIKISPNVRITERWEKGDRFHEKEFRLGKIDNEITRLKDNIRYNEKRSEKC